MDAITYAYYQGEKFIDLGTKEYLAKLLGVSTKTIQFYATPTYKKRNKGKTDTNVVVIRIEDDDCD